jgi:hypothetical protein
VEITFEVDAKELTDDVRDLLSKLSDERKEELAVKMLTEALKSGETTLAKYVGVEKALEDVNQGKEKERYRFNSKENRLECENGHFWIPDNIRQRFDYLVKQHAQFYGYFQETILDKMLTVAVERVEKLVQDSPAIQKAIDGAVREIEAQFPHIVQAAMQRLFLNVLEGTIRNSHASADTQNEHSEMLKQLQERLDRNLY